MEKELMKLKQENEQRANRLGQIQFGARLFDVTFDNPDFGLLVVEYDRETSKFTRVSESVKNLLGYDKSEVIDKKNYDFIHPDDIASTINESAKQLIKAKEASGYDNRLRKKNGAYVTATWFSAGGKDARQIAYAMIT